MVHVTWSGWLYASSSKLNLPENTQELCSLIVSRIESLQNSAVIQNMIFLTLKELAFEYYF